MKHLCVAVALVAASGAALAFRGALWYAAAARAPEEARAGGEARPTRERQPAPEAASLAVVPAGGEKDAAGTDALLARLAAECGDHLLERARQQPDNPHLLNQAAQHYRACLDHEPTCRDAALFAGVRGKLEQVERLQARLAAKARPAPALRPAPPAPAEEKPAAVPEGDSPPPAPVKVSAAGRMVGPDGVTFRRVGD
jgi:hypothetical protein